MADPLDIINTDTMIPLEPTAGLNSNFGSIGPGIIRYDLRNNFAIDPGWGAGFDHFDSPSINDSSENLLGDQPPVLKPADLGPQPEPGESSNLPSFATPSTGSLAVMAFWPANNQSPSAVITSTPALAQSPNDFHFSVDPALVAISLSSPGAVSIQPLTTILSSSNAAPLDLGHSGRGSDRPASGAKPPAWSTLSDSATDQSEELGLDFQPPVGRPVEGTVQVDAVELDGQVSQILSRIGSLGIEVGEGPEQSRIYYWFAAAGLLSAGAGYVVHVNRRMQRLPGLSLSRISVGHWKGEEHDSGNC